MIVQPAYKSRGIGWSHILRPAGVCGVLVLLLAATTAGAQQHRLPVEYWTLRSEEGEIGPIDAPVPGVVHTALHEADVIPDPYFGDNEQRLAWVDSTTWVYETIIGIPPLMQEPMLVFDGLDTLADIYIDDELVLSANNMFRQWRVPLDPTIETFDVRIVFHPAALEAERLASEYPYPLPESPRMFVRKAAYHFGWDWGPRFITAGPWKGVFLEDANVPKLEGTYLRTAGISEDGADVELVTILQSTEAESAEIIVRMDGEEVVRASVGGFLDGEIRIPFSMANPRLWWPRGSGEAYLYNMEVEVIVLGHTIHEQQPVGIRTVELDQSD